MYAKLSTGGSPGSSVFRDDLEQLRELGLVEEHPLFGEKEPNLFRELGEDVGDLYGERRVDVRKLPELGDDLLRVLDREAGEPVGVLLRERRLPGEGPATGLLG